MTARSEGDQPILSSSPEWWVIVNGARVSQATLRHLADTCEKLDLKVRIKKTEFHGHAASLVQQALQLGLRNIAVAGGDGTLHSSVQGLMAWGGNSLDVRMGIIPMGTGNDVARGLGLPRELDASLRVLQGDSDRVVDTAHVRWDGGTATMINSLGLGFDVTVLSHLNRSWGKLSYLKAFVKAMGEVRPLDVLIRSAERDWTGNCMGLVLMLGSHTGGGMRPVAGSTLGSGQIHLSAIAPLGFVGILKRLPSLLGGGMRADKAVTQWTSSHINFECSPEAPFHIDGEIKGSSPVDVTLKQRTLRFAVSREWR
ncbi:MAG: diacylglycerol kinase family protein [Planctomycetota bacterium]